MQNKFQGLKSRLHESNVTYLTVIMYDRVNISS